MSESGSPSNVEVKYIPVTDKTIDPNEVVELLLSRDGNLPLASLGRAFTPDAYLEYQSTGGKRIVSFDSTKNVFLKPPDGWEGKQIDIICKENRSREILPYSHVQGKPPILEAVRKFCFYLHLKDFKTCVTRLDYLYFATFRHNDHKDLKEGEKVTIYSDEGTPFRATVKCFHDNWDYVLLKSDDPIDGSGPTICCSECFGEPLLLCGRGNHSGTLATREGNIYMTEKVKNCPFLLGTIKTSDGDSGGGVFDRHGLVGISVGNTPFLECLYKIAVSNAATFNPNNFMVLATDLIAARASVEARDTPLSHAHKYLAPAPKPGSFRDSPQPKKRRYRESEAQTGTGTQSYTGTAEFSLFKVHERSAWVDDFEEERKRSVYVNHLSEMELPQAEGLSSTCQPFAIRCGKGSRLAVLFAEPEHDSHCTEHIGHLILNLHRKQNNWIQLPACPSDAIFGRYGEILIVGLYNGEFLLLSTLEGNIGQVLWNGGGPTAGLHTRAITQFQWLDEHKGILISVGLDGKVIKSRLEPNNQLELLEGTQITLSDLPKHLHRESESDQSVGLIGVSIFNDCENKKQLWITTEACVLIQIGGEHLKEIKYTQTLFENRNSGETAEQFISFISGKERIFLWKTSDGRILQKITKSEDGHLNNYEISKLLSIGRSKSEFSVLTDNTNLLFTLSANQQKSSVENELIVLDILNDELLLRDSQIGECLETFTLDKHIMIGISSREIDRGEIEGEPEKKYFLNFYEIVLE